MGACGVCCGSFASCGGLCAECVIVDCWPHSSNSSRAQIARRQELREAIEELLGSGEAETLCAAQDARLQIAQLQQRRKLAREARRAALESSANARGSLQARGGDDLASSAETEAVAGASSAQIRLLRASEELKMLRTHIAEERRRLLPLLHHALPLTAKNGLACICGLDLPSGSTAGELESRLHLQQPAEYGASLGLMYILLSQLGKLTGAPLLHGGAFLSSKSVVWRVRGGAGEQPAGGGVLPLFGDAAAAADGVLLLLRSAAHILHQIHPEAQGGSPLARLALVMADLAGHALPAEPLLGPSSPRSEEEAEDSWLLIT